MGVRVDRFFVCLLFVTLARIAPAQVTASISGKVEDASGAPVRGATVTVRSVETGATRTATTDDSGEYRVLALPVGPQEVKAEKTGFRAGIRTGVNLAVGQEAVVNLRLEVGEIAQTVTVAADAPVVNTTTTQVSGLVTEQQIKDLPLNGRSFDNLITLNPGAINYSAMKAAGTSTSDGNTFTVSGRRTSENTFLLNGIEYTGASQLGITPGGASGELLGIDAIREFNVLTDTYPAEYGKRAGAQISVVTQSGSNVLHGTVFEFLRNSAVDARNFFDQATVPPFRRNQFGGALGGPLKKDKLFLFGNYEGFRQALAESDLAVVPDNEARQGFLPNSSGVYTQVANLNPKMLPYVQSFWPAVNGPELMAGGLPTGTALSYNNPRQSIREDFGTLRSDYIVGSKDSLSAAYTIDDGFNLSPMTDPLFGATLLLRSQVASVEETHVFSPDLLNTLRIGFSRASFTYNPDFFATFPSSLSFVNGYGPGGITIGGSVTTTGLAAITAAGPNNASYVWDHRNLFTYSDDFQIVKGRHQISLGVWFQPVEDNEDTASRHLGAATFSTLTSFLQGTVSNFQVVPNPTALGWRSLFGAWYAQDNIRLRPNLTLQLGVRDEFTTGWNEQFGRAANFITSGGILETNPIVGNSVYTENNATRLFAPRTGLAWDPFGNAKTVVRAGYGMYYSLIDNLSFLMNSLPPYNSNLSYSNTSLFSIIPIVPTAPIAPACGPGVPTPCTTFAPQGVQPNAKTPTVQEWKFSIEQQLSANTVLRLSYVGEFGYHGLLSVDPNTIPAQICENAAGCVSGGTPGTTKGFVPQGAQYIPVTTRPNPYLSAGFFWYTEGNSSYNALQVDVSRRLSKGLLFRANYTWSKNLDFNSALTGAQAENQAQMILNRNDLGQDWGPSALNITNQASASAHYDLPFGAGQHWLNSAGGLEGKLASGWQVNTIVTLLSGFPFTPLIGTNRSGDGDTRDPDRPDLNPAFAGPVIVGSPNEWFNPNAFILPTAGTYGNLGRGTYTGPGLAEVDFSAFKDTRISERANLQFRAEFFNIGNRANFAYPNTTVFSGTSYSGSARQIQFGMKLIF
jgi:Carboxypeptidase regulatory-like domain/TonB-dependent Receptor Plug Domain